MRGSVMGQALNTMVNGSAGTCDQAAAWLRKLQKHANQAAGKSSSARGVADGGRWTGPASGYFLDSTSEMTRESTAVADRAGKYARALITFASALRSVNQTMDQALEKARSGGLRIEGP